MNIGKIHEQFLSSRLLLSIFAFVFISLRIYLISNQLDNLFLWAVLLIQLGVAFFLLQLNHTFNIIQEHTFLPTLFYFLFVGINPAFYNDLRGSIAVLCVVLSYHCLFASNQNPNSQLNALNISLLLVLGSLFWTPLLIFFPVFWWGFYHFQSFSARVFFASLTGFAIVYLVIFTLSVYFGDRSIFFSLLPDFDTLLVFQKPELTTLEWISWGGILLLYLVIGVSLFVLTISEKVWTLSVLNYFYFTSFFFFLLFFLQNEYKSVWELIIYLPIAFLAGHFFSRSNSRIVQYFLLLFFLFFIGIGIARYIGA